MKTFNKAIEMAEKGYWGTSYSVAMQDEGIDKGATMFEWKKFAEKVIADRKERQDMPEAYYS